MERIYAEIIPTNGIPQTVPRVEACAHTSSLREGVSHMRISHETSTVPAVSITKAS